MGAPTLRPVVAGIDGTPDTLVAAAMAAAEAQWRGVPLRLVCAYLPAPASYTREHARWKLIEDAERFAQEAVAEISRTHDELQVTGASVAGDLADVLLLESVQATMVVVAGGHTSGIDGLLGRSTSTRVAMGGHCPVLVVRAPDLAHSGSSISGSASKLGDLSQRPVIVGVDGSAQSTRTLAFAFGEVARRRVPLRVVNVHPADGESRASRVIADSLGELPEQFPQVEWQSMPRYAESAEAGLIQSSAEAGLVVVGSRGRGPLTSLLLGSVSRGLIHHAHCPVTVVRGG